MKRVRDYLRERLEQKAGLVDSPRLPDLEVLRETEWSKEFEKLMRNRLLFGAFRYGLFTEKGRLDYDYIKSVVTRLALYQKTGNTEHLVDVANCCMLEFEFGRHPEKHFHSTDDGVHVNVKPTNTQRNPTRNND